MAQHKIGNKYLNDEEYELHATGVWGFFLFVIGAFITGHTMQDVVPDSWDKIWRFIAIVTPAVIVGGGLAFLAPYIRMLFFAGLFIGAICGAVYWVWSVV